MAKKSNAKRIERLEQIIIGSGFLLQKLNVRYGKDFSFGMVEQVQQCIRDCNQVGATVQQRSAKLNAEQLHKAANDAK